MRGLPPEAATHRKDRLPPAEEYAARLVELTDQWWRLFLAWRSGKRIQLPPEVLIERPGVERPQKRVVRPAQFAAEHQAHERR